MGFLFLPLYDTTNNTMKKTILPQFLKNLARIQKAARQSDDGQRCLIAPHPKIKKQIKQEIKKLKAKSAGIAALNEITIKEVRRPGFNDGLIYPGNALPLGTPLMVAKKKALEKQPLRGPVRVAVVLVDFPDKPMKKSKQHFEDLFFSKGVVPTGSVREYFHEVTNGLIDIQGQVVGPYRMPKKITAYANKASGVGEKFPNARTLARDAAIRSNPGINYAPYDNDKDGYVDAFVVVHAGTGGETTNNPNDIWSHKWVLQGNPYNADGSTKIYAYLTVPEDCKLGVCAHELGHLLFGFPDLYDADYSSEGVGDWCLMGGGSWNNNGLTPAHPSAWCKCNQGWVNIKVPTTNMPETSIGDVKETNEVYKLWFNGAPQKEYFLLENRQQSKFDSHIPASGLLIWHVDDSIESNEDEGHYKVALVQADGKEQLEAGTNRGDGGDCYPGTAKNTRFDNASTPSSASYGGIDSKVAVTGIKVSGTSVKAKIAVK